MKSLTSEASGAGRGDQPLRVCMITTFYPPFHFGGDAIGIARLARGLVRRGHEVTVIHDVDAFAVLHHGPLPEPPSEPEGLTVHRLRSRLGPLSPLLTQQLGRPVAHGRRIRALIDRGRFDVINYHNVSLVGGPGLLSVGRGLKVYMCHEHWLVCPTHVLWRHGREACTGRECIRCSLRQKRPPQYWRYTGLLEQQLEHVDLFVAMSQFSRDKHREFGFPRDMAVLPYFLPDPESPAPPVPTGPSPHSRPYFLFVGRLERIKGLDDVIPLFERYRDADLLIAGEGEHRTQLERLASRIPNVRFLGRLPPDTLRDYYRHAIALIVPSVCFETFGIIIIESFREATPVIARRIGPFPEILEQAGGGELFDQPHELVAAMGRLQRDRGRRDAMGVAGFHAYCRYWSERAVVPQFLKLIADAAARRADDVAGRGMAGEARTAAWTG
jgi:glycosyltransferase involved in cell wall biosynthesis